MKNIVVVDPFPTGHHLTYLCTFTLCFLRQGNRVLALCPQPDLVREYVRQQAPELEGQLEAVLFADGNTSYDGVAVGNVRAFVRVLKRWLKITRLLLSKPYRGLKPKVFLPWIDSYLNKFLGPVLHRIIFPFDWSCLYFQPKIGRFIVQPQKLHHRFFDRERIFRSRRCKSVGVLVEDEIPELSRRIGGKEVLLYPDFAHVEHVDLVATKFAFLRDQIAGKFSVGLFGSLASRKGIHTLLDVAFSLRDDPRFFFLFTGEMIESTFSADELKRLAFIRQKCEGKNAYFFTERIETEEELNTIMKSVNLIFAVYERFPFSSNMLTKAANLAVPVIASETSYIGRLTKEFGLGTVIPPGDRLALEEELLRLQGERKDTLPEGWDGESFINRNSVKRLEVVLENAL
ncbi:glycosyltransferase [Haliea sp. E17]|uniref:glycosyltransferase n=1 Tax=Haliea sp. E17 TaxID=3401576 RepID=UPI003AABA92B